MEQIMTTDEIEALAESGFTAGPYRCALHDDWCADYYGNDNSSCKHIQDSNGEAVALVVQRGVHWSDGKLDATAELFTAAPRLLATVQARDARIAELEGALRDAAEHLRFCRDFMQNGFELGYIRKPEKDDPAYTRLPETGLALLPARKALEWKS